MLKIVALKQRKCNQLLFLWCVASNLQNTLFMAWIDALENLKGQHLLKGILEFNKCLISKHP